MDSKNAINAKKHISPIITTRECSASNISVILLLLFHALNRKKNTGTNHMACSNLHIRFRLSFRNTFFFTLFPLFFYYFTPIKKCLRHSQLPCPLIHEGKGGSFVFLYCKILLWIYYNLSLPIIMNTSFTNSIPVLLSLKMSTRWFIVVTLLTVVPCMAVLTVEILNLFPFAVKAVFALPVETNTTSFVLFICPVSLFLVFIAIVKWNPHIHWSIFS